jgi:hypothetical protein
MATSLGCFRTHERRPLAPAPQRRRDTEREVEVLEIDALPQQRGDRFAARAGFDPRARATPDRWFRISPRRIQVWREVNELPDRELMRDGRPA